MYSLINYKELMSSLKKRGYNIRPFSGFNGNTIKPTLLLRFDIDYCPKMAIEIAEINAEIGLSGTFFLQMDSPLYNIFNWKTQEVLKKLLALKQEIGWHVTFERRKTTNASLINGWRIFKKAVPEAVPLIAWHNPQKDLLDKANSMVQLTCKLRSVYAQPFMSDKIKYLSDSNRRNGFADLMNKLHIETFPQVQLLLHPLNWVIGGDEMKTILKSAWKSVLTDIDKEFSTNPNWHGFTHED